MDPTSIYIIVAVSLVVISLFVYIFMNKKTTENFDTKQDLAVADLIKMAKNELRLRDGRLKTKNKELKSATPSDKSTIRNEIEMINDDIILLNSIITKSTSTGDRWVEIKNLIEENIDWRKRGKNVGDSQDDIHLLNKLYAKLKV